MKLPEHGFMACIAFINKAVFAAKRLLLNGNVK